MKQWDWRTIGFAILMIMLIYAFSQCRFSCKSKGILTMQVEPRAREAAVHWIYNPETSSYVWVFQDEPYWGELEYYYLFGWVDGKFVLFSKRK